MHDPEPRALAEHQAAMSPMTLAAAMAVASDEAMSWLADAWHAHPEEYYRYCSRCGSEEHIAEECPGPRPAPEPSDPAPAPARPSLAPQFPPLAPRPFSQLARRFHRLGLVVPRGLWPALSGAPWYEPFRRRRPAIAMCRSRARTIAARRSSRVFWRRYPPITVEAA